jgi:hypothetical protein
MFCVVRTYIDIEEVVTIAVEIEHVLGELGETPYEPMKEEQDETMFRESTTDRQLHVLNETLINFFGKGTDGKARPSSIVSVNINNRCQLCQSREHTASTCPKFADTRPKCAKCGGGHKIDNCGLKCFFCLGLGHTKERCWKKTTKGLHAPTNFLEVLVDDEEATLVELNCVCGDDYHVFSGVKIVELQVKVGGIICQMIFLVVDIYNYDLLLGLDFLIKIGAIVDVEKGVI